MTDLDTLTSLRERVIAAEGPDREIDAAIWLATTPGATRVQRQVNHHVRPWVIDETRDPTGRLIIVPEVTDSIDAALALVERMLPGWYVNNLCEWQSPKLRERGKWMCILDRLDRTDGLPGAFGSRCNHAPTPPLAILAALLSALIANAKGET